MPRPQRLEYENALYHVMNRGRGRQMIFREPEDYENFLHTLDEAHERFGLQVHAYCLMGNHYHLLVKTPRANLSRSMRHVNGLYTQRFNRRTKTDGPLFRGRFKAVLVEADSYLLQLTRYIHCNPVELSWPLVSQLEDYPWSSYPAYLNRTPSPPWLYREQTYNMLGHRQRYSQYKHYVEQGVDKDIRDFYQKGRLAPVLGTDPFKEATADENWHNVTREKLREQLFQPAPPERIIAVVSEVFGVDSSVVLHGKRSQRNPARWVAMAMCQRYCGWPLSRIAEYFHLLSISGVSYSLRRLRNGLEHDVVLNDQLKLINQHLTP